MRTPVSRSGIAAGALTLALLAGGSLASAAPAPEDSTTPQRVAGAQQAQTQADAEEYVPLPELAVTHSLPNGGMNLWRMPLSDLEAGYGEPQLVKQLRTGGFSYGRSRTVAGNFGDLTVSDDGTADHVIWHAQPDGSVLLWAVAGAADAADREPRLWADLRTGGWSFDNSKVLAGDVTGDGWDDLVVIHATDSGYKNNMWVFRSDGTRLGSPELWFPGAPAHRGQRWLLGDVNGDGASDLVSVREGVDRGLHVTHMLSWGGSFGLWRDAGEQAGAGWSFNDSRQLLGDVTGDGVLDLVSTHAQYWNSGMLVWLHRGQLTGGGSFSFAPAQVWQDLRSGGWSYANSRQHLADTNGDWIDDLVSVHAQTGIPGELVWRHLSSGAGLYEPEVVVDLRTGGWNYHASRESVAALFGTFAF